MLHFNVVTLFPEFFASPLSCGLLAKAQASGVISVRLQNPREFALNKHRHLDDSPYGGGPGMVLQAEPLLRCLEHLAPKGPIIMLTPRGRPFTQEVATKLAAASELTLICGRYEGVDERVIDLAPCPVESICVTDAVLNSGDSAALVLLEACARLQPGFMGKLDSQVEESFTEDLLEYPQYTRPEELNGLKVPEVLLSGHHQHIAKFRREKALATTLKFRPELLATTKLTAQDASYLKANPPKRLGRNLSLCLVHHPVRIEGRTTGTASLTNLDIHDISRISASYGLGPFYVVTPLTQQLTLLEQILSHWLHGMAKENHPDRAQALSLVRPVPSLAAAQEEASCYYGAKPTVVVSSANWSDKHAPKMIVPADVRAILLKGPVLLLLGTAQGLAKEVLSQCNAVLRPLRFLGYNHLSVRSAAAILTDRILGDFA
ncbi:MAG: tRNA (guanosine(37)-N1)-methyltransferase TrmD [Desulfovibrionaceae bacterium]|nr:tRNA (guanosine(37)-N1)-methyltransferase TrmD [Desulfovibrionaceae bacterium]